MFDKTIKHRQTWYNQTNRQCHSPYKDHSKIDAKLPPLQLSKVDLHVEQSRKNKLQCDASDATNDSQ